MSGQESDTLHLLKYVACGPTLQWVVISKSSRTVLTHSVTSAPECPFPVPARWSPENNANSIMNLVTDRWENSNMYLEDKLQK